MVEMGVLAVLAVGKVARGVMYLIVLITRSVLVLTPAPQLAPVVVGVGGLLVMFMRLALLVEVGRAR
jgi:hypothetical protein